MDRDAAAPPVEVVPPVDWKVARNAAAAGAGLIAVAALLGLAGDLGHVRAALVFVGAVAAGFGAWLRPDRWEAWAVCTGAAVLAAVAAVPASWDSFRLLFWLFAAAAGLRLAVTAAPAWRLRLVSAYMLFHFVGLFCAVTAPSPTPWLIDQAYLRVYNQYLQPIYMRNAYHFYSPEPGPASILAALVKTENGTETTATGEVRKKYDTRWVVMPRRPAHVLDPLAISYFRRLSITDRLSRSNSDFTSSAGAFEKTDVRQRRYRLTLPGSDPYYPLHPTEPEFLQYRMPTPEGARFLIPSFAQHLILESTPTPEAAARTTLKMYRLEHRTLPVEALVGFGNPDGQPTDPYNPMTYRPYFLGEYRLTSADPSHPRKARVELVDPQADMLYWLIPILPNPAPAPTDKKPFVDYLSTHAGHAFDWSQLR